MNFKRYPYKTDEKFYSETGEKIKPTYTEKISDEGTKYLEKTGEHNHYEEIQKALPETEIYNILNRYINGDETALNKSEGTYMDISNLPTSMIEAHNLISETKADFNRLPKELIEEFGSYENYIKEMTEGSGVEKVYNYFEKEQKINNKNSDNNIEPDNKDSKPIDNSKPSTN